MTKKCLEIGGRTFELIKKGSHNAHKPSHGLGSIYAAYERPSSTKVSIFESWQTWFWENRQGIFDDMYIGSFNTMIFTLCGTITYNGKTYDFKITPTYNYIWKR